MLKLSITKRFFAGGLVMITAFVVAIGIALIATINVNNAFQTFVQKDLALLNNLQRMYTSGIQGGAATRHIILVPEAQTTVETYKETVNEFTQANEAAIKVAPPAMAKELQALLSDLNELDKVRLAAQGFSVKGQKNDAIETLEDETPLWVNLRDKIADMINSQSAKTAATQQQLKAFTHKRIQTTVIIAVVALVLSGGLLFFLIVQHIKNPLQDLTMVAKAIGRGDLSKKVAWTRSDEMGELGETINNTIERLKKLVQSDEERAKAQENIINFLNLLSSASEGDLTVKAEVTSDVFGSVGDAFNLMLEGLTELVEKVRVTSEKVSSESKNILSVLQKIEGGSEAQSLEVKRAREAVETATDSATDITRKASQAQNISDAVVRAVEKGNHLVLESTEGMQFIRATVQSINKRMKYLSERLLEIGTVSQLITDVSSKTDLLAINAAIEAAKAGEHGKGFVVIAEEIRNLAEKASKSTKQIGEIISAIQVESTGVTKYLEEETNYVEIETKLSADTTTAFREIDSSIKDTVLVISEIHASADTQRELTARVVSSMEEVQRITREMLNLVKDVSTISGSLSDTSNSLISSVERFKLSETEKLTA
ncbi:MAG: hypothetical protein CVV37_06195 [Nitrospira bacterium HGW-Nitrospira-1]|nr:MAG: hypothetical protein CVV37_06195 [Nitrospira bacterium HGW-Nitrospira-1]